LKNGYKAEHSREIEFFSKIKGTPRESRNSIDAPPDPLLFQLLSEIIKQALSQVSPAPQTQGTHSPQTIASLQKPISALHLDI